MKINLKKINIKKIFKSELLEFIKSKKFAIIIVACLLILFFCFFIFSYQLETPLSKNVEERVFAIKQGQGAEEIAEDLRTQGFISNKWAFFYYIWLKGKTTTLLKKWLKESGNVQNAEQRLQNFPLNQIKTDQFTVKNAGQRKEVKKEVGILVLEKCFKETGNAQNVEKRLQNFLSSQILTNQFTAEIVGQRNERRDKSDYIKNSVVSDTLFFIIKCIL